MSVWDTTEAPYNNSLLLGKTTKTSDHGLDQEQEEEEEAAEVTKALNREKHPQRHSKWTNRLPFSHFWNGDDPGARPLEMEASVGSTAKAASMSNTAKVANAAKKVSAAKPSKSVDCEGPKCDEEHVLPVPMAQKQDVKDRGKKSASSSNSNKITKSYREKSSPSKNRQINITTGDDVKVHVGIDIGGRPASWTPPASSGSTRIPLPDHVLREMEMKEFYKNYDAMEGALTAVVLGGFFAFVCLLVMYKTKCKPMWKNRRKRLTTTPATASVVEQDSTTGQPAGAGGLFGQPPALIQQNMMEDEDDEFGFECIPLQSVCNEEDNDDIYFLDEYGNYVFPVSSPTIPPGTSCSCPPSAEELNTLRRVSQVSTMSNAYTVKSLPGAYLYIPVLDSQHVQNVPPSSLPSVKRALSDPQIHFATPLGGHPIILTVNPSSEHNASSISTTANGTAATANNVVHHRRGKHKNKLQQRSFSVQQEPPLQAITCQPEPGSLSLLEDVKHKLSSVSAAPGQVIDIHVIQPTPNISPSASLSGEGAEAILEAATEAAIEEKKSPELNRKVKEDGKPIRRVSFSEDEVEAGTGQPLLRLGGDEVSLDSPSSLRRRSSRASSYTTARQMTVPMAAAPMSYLQVPGQQNAYIIAPPLSAEAHAAQISPQARRRRSTRLMKTGSFCSITSEGDGDIFNASGQLKTERSDSTTSSGDKNRISRLSSTSSAGEQVHRQKKNLDPLSDYSEFQDEVRSDISELFSSGSCSHHHHVPEEQVEKKQVKEQQCEQRLNAQGTLSDEQGSIRSLSMDQEEITYEAPTVKDTEAAEQDLQLLMRPQPGLLHTDGQEELGDAEEELYASSSCSISIGSDTGDNEKQQQCGGNNQITVPVTIEHPPPELRPQKQMPQPQAQHHHHHHHHRQLQAQPQVSDAGCQQAVPAAIAHLPRPVTAAVAAEDITAAKLMPLEQMEAVAGMSAAAAASLDIEPGTRMVLVRDIGIQVSGDSPNLNLQRRAHHHHHRRAATIPPAATAVVVTQQPTNSAVTVASAAAGSSAAAATATKQDSLADKFPAEILF